MNQAKIYIPLLLTLTLLASCGSQPGPATESKTTVAENSEVTPSKAAITAASRIVETNMDSVIELAHDEQLAHHIVGGLRAMRWSSVPLANNNDLETIVYDGLRVQIGSGYGEYIKSFGERYSNGDLGEDAYVNSMLLADAFFSGIMHSHESIRDRGADPAAYPIQSALTYAPLMRLAIAQELEKFGFEDRGILSKEQRQRLRGAVRDKEYETYDQYP